LKNQFFKYVLILLALFLLVPLFLVACAGTEAPWPGIRIQINENKKITVNNGDLFIIRFTMSYDLFPIIQEIYDDNIVVLQDRGVNATEQQNQSPSYSWFLFKVIGPGETQITIEHRGHITLDLIEQKTYTVIIK
jgi:hypothetical protein